MGFSKKTKRLIEEYESMGYEIIIGNNPRLPEAKKWADYECVRLCLTNSKHHGYSVHTVWAVRKWYVFKLEHEGNQVIDDWEQWAYNLLYEVDGDNIRRCDGYIVTTNKDLAESYEIHSDIADLDGDDFCRLVRQVDLRLSWSADRFGCQTMMIKGGE